MKKTRVQLGGKMWTVRLSARKLKGHVGYCAPHEREIVLCRSLDEHERRAIFIHEAFHALNWQLSEDVVDAGAQELSDALDDLDF